MFNITSYYFVQYFFSTHLMFFFKLKNNNIFRNDILFSFKTIFIRLALKLVLLFYYLLMRKEEC